MMRRSPTQGVPELGEGVGPTNGAQRGRRGGGSPVGRAGHPRARRSSSQVLAMALLRGGRTQLQT